MKIVICGISRGSILIKQHMSKNSRNALVDRNAILYLFRGLFHFDSVTLLLQSVIVL